jgi:colicin import membrane protein
MNKTQPLAISGLTNFSVTISDDAQQRKADALELSRSITAVSNAAQQQDAITAAALIKGLLKSVEATREELKRPILDAGRELDDCAKIYSGNLKAELARVEKLASNWQAQENRRLEAIRLEQERIAREAAEKAEQERLAALAAEQERQRQADAARLRELEAIQAAATEEARLAAQVLADAAAEKRAREAKAAQEAEAAAQEQRMEEARQRQQEQLAIPVPKAAGARVSTAKDYEVLDIRALYLARPDLVTLDPKRSLILAAIAIPGASIAGIRVFETTKVQAKAL